MFDAQTLKRVNFINIANYIDISIKSFANSIISERFNYKRIVLNITK